MVFFKITFRFQFHVFKEKENLFCIPNLCFTIINPNTAGIIQVGSLKIIEKIKVKQRDFFCLVPDCENVLSSHGFF